jgi:hypothetical protein
MPGKEHHNADHVLGYLLALNTPPRDDPLTLARRLTGVIAAIVRDVMTMATRPSKLPNAAPLTLADGFAYGRRR